MTWYVGTYLYRCSVKTICIHGAKLSLGIYLLGINLFREEDRARTEGATEIQLVETLTPMAALYLRYIKIVIITY